MPEESYNICENDRTASIREFRPKESQKQENWQQTYNQVT